MFSFRNAIVTTLLLSINAFAQSTHAPASNIKTVQITPSAQEAEVGQKVKLSVTATDASGKVVKEQRKVDAFERIHIEEFRGIRSLDLALNQENFAVCGPNGTGKSGIVDALEFALTGDISRLSGKGRGALSVKEHGPHVDSRSTPERARVTVEVTIPALKKKATIERSVKTLRAPIIRPDEPAVRAVFKNVEEHPEFVLSRREIALLDAIGQLDLLCRRQQRHFVDVGHIRVEPMVPHWQSPLM